MVHTARALFTCLVLQVAVAALTHQPNVFHWLPNNIHYATSTELQQKLTISYSSMALHRCKSHKNM